ncbi:MAG: hypothetical protein GKR97_15155 [Rhizobiaceae bacterium]|nr:hypothetical protein [Rhizobiaceae bacterium]
MKKLLLASAVLAVAMVSANASETFNIGGVGKGTNQTMMEIVGDGHMLLNTVSTYESFESADTSNPFENMNGKCWGAIEIKVPSASGHGNCVFTDTSGDKHYNMWTAKGLSKDGALVGTWALIGGTGKYENASGGGTFHSMTDRKAGTFVNTVSGALIVD